MGIISDSGTPFTGYVSLTNAAPGPALFSLFVNSAPFIVNPSHILTITDVQVSSDDAINLVTIDSGGFLTQKLASVYASSALPTYAEVIPPGIGRLTPGQVPRATAAAVASGKTVECTIQGNVRQIGTLFDPTQIPGLVGWWRTDLGITLNVGNISAWADQSGNSYNLTQGTAANQPGYNATGGPNNLPFTSWVGAGGAHRLIGAGVLGNQPIEVFCAARSTTSAPGTAQTLWDFGSNNNLCTQQVTVNTLQLYDGLFSAGSVALTIGNDYIVNCLYSGASSRINLNGGADQTGNPSTNISSSAFQVGNSGPANVELGGRIYEVAIYNRVGGLLASERLRLSRYMGSRWQVSVP